MSALDDLRVEVESRSPLVSNVRQGQGQGLGQGKNTEPLTQPPSSSSSFHSDDDVPPLVEWLLAEHKAGRRQPVAVTLPVTAPLPPKVQAVADFYARVRGLRLATANPDTRPVPFGCAWVGRHLDMPKATVWRALQTLEAEGVLKQVGNLPGRDKQGVHLWLPGDGAS